MSHKAQIEITRILNQIAKAFDLDNTPLLVQTIVDGDNVWVIEFSARIGGGQKHVNIKERTGFDILHQNVNCVLGEPLVLIKNEACVYVSRTHLYMYPGVFDHIANAAELLKDGTISQLVCTKSTGTEIDSISSSTSRIGSFMVRAQSEKELNEKIMKTLALIRVENKEGIDLLYRPMYK